MTIKRKYKAYSSNTHSLDILKHAYNALLHVYLGFSTNCPIFITVPLP